MTHIPSFPVFSPPKYLPILLFCLAQLAAGYPVQAQSFHPDSTFGANGFVLPAYSGADQAHAVLVQPADQKIVVTGFNSGNCYVARFLPNGQPDMAFGIAGRTTFKFGNLSSYGYALALQSDGKILVAGDASQSSAGLARLTPAGALDPTFDTDGKLTVPTPNVAVFDSDARLGLAVQPADQRIVLGITSAPDDATNKMATIHRFMPNGSADLSFSGDGKAFIDFSPGKNEVVSAVAVQPDGKIVVGAFANVDGGNYGNRFAVSRLNTDGSLDSGFGSSGITIAGKGVLLDLRLQPDGKIVTAGYNRYFPIGIQEEKDIALMRFTANGALDPVFGTGGTVYTDYDWCHANGMALQPDGKIVVAGFLHPNNPFDFLVGRYHANGTLDLTFRPDGFWAYRINGKDEELHKVAIQDNGDIVAAGYYELGGQDESVLLRLTPRSQPPILPTAKFTLDNPTGCAPLTVQFSDQSSNATSWSWQFPGGTPAASTDQNPTVTYNTSSLGFVTLIASNSAGSDTVKNLIFVTVKTLPTAIFSAAPNGTNVTFSNTSTNATSYSWNFGDGQGSTIANPSHTYATEGTYTVTLTATNDCGSATVTQELVVGQGLMANFSSTNSVGCVPLTVQFTDQSQNATTWQWNFPGGTPATSAQQNPTVTYTTPGKHDVTLTVTHPTYGSKSKTLIQLVEVRPLPTVAFSIEHLGGQTYQFQNASTNADGYVWEFFDGTPATSTEVNPTVTYATPGTHTARLSALNNCGASILEKTLTMSNTAEPSWAAGLRLFPNPTDGLLQVEISEVSKGETVFSLFDPAGHMLRSQSSAVRGEAPFLQVFDLSDLPAGVYALRVQIDSVAVTRRIFVAP